MIDWLNWILGIIFYYFFLIPFAIGAFCVLCAFALFFLFYLSPFILGFVTLLLVADGQFVFAIPVGLATWFFTKLAAAYPFGGDDTSW